MLYKQDDRISKMLAEAAEVASSKNINLATNIPIEYLKDEENYAMIYNYDLDYYDNLKLNGFNSLWDCGSIQYTIPFRRINE